VSVGLDWSDLRVVCRVNGKVKQDGRTRDQIFPVSRLLAFISAGMTLEPGDVVTTGTPDGVGPIRRATPSRSRSRASACCATRW